jgi:hypothetical protein
MREPMSDRGAGTFEMPFRDGKTLRIARAWKCSQCPVSWYDGGRECPRCKTMTGEPEPLPEGARLVEVNED